MIQEANALDFLAAQGTASAHLIIADPPYRTTKLAFDKAPPLDFAAWWAEVERVLVPAGVVLMFSADLFTVDMILANRAAYRYRMVWVKSKATGFLSAKKRPMRGHEDILVFGRNADASTFNPQKSRRGAASVRKSIYRKNQATAHYGTHRNSEYADDGTRYPTSVLEFDSVPTLHCLNPTEKPLDLIRTLVRSYSNEGERVLDTFSGSGVTAHACLLEGREFAGCDVDPQQVTQANVRLQSVQVPSLFQ
ncbi:DNA-methyltransferase [Hymenobacter metallilatus]|uniref:Methyltransferase n=1 Tax=Hymenobacter metallilatus TaxID=2493666 RepID=A0A3R9M9J7_9BACT|nr:site-specific DNA-methyltransferase [Hymenobacter metallilatus]RSK33938.1 site-specific DNA-methyltransferase [Hymenobacter metallilatus]